MGGTRPLVVLISSVPWHATWQRHHDIAGGLAERGYRVVFLDPLPKRWPKLWEARRVVGRLIGNASLSGKTFQPMPEGVQHLLPFSLPDTSRLLQWLNRRFFVPRIARQITQLRQNASLIVINYLPTPTSLALHEALRPDFSIYDCVVDWSTHPTAATLKLSRYEEILAHNVDVVLADSPFLWRKMQSLRPDALQMLPGVHTKDFAECRAIPPSVHKTMEKEIVCAYFGGIRDALDYELLQKVAHNFSLKMIGPVEDPHALLYLQEAQLMGGVPYHRLAMALCDADVLLLPYSPRQPHVRGVIPAKTFQCLATGKPTVVYGLESLQQFSDVFYIAYSHEEFLQLIRVAVREYAFSGRRQRALEMVREHDWQRRIDFLESLWRGLEQGE